MHLTFAALKPGLVVSGFSDGNHLETEYLNVRFFDGSYLETENWNV